VEKPDLTAARSFLNTLNPGISISLSNIHRVKWRNISMVTIRSLFCRSKPSYCA